jgi:outer membrane protein OmpA-like peptidoglycan-associated protein
VATADQQELIFTRRISNDNEADEDLVVSRKNKDGRWTSPVSISKNINSRWNEGTCTISADGRKLIFTSCLGRDGFGSCDLFQSIKIGDEWTAPVNLGPNVNTADWESQPSLSADGRMLYFVSDRRGGLGRRDIWVSHLGADGIWMKAENAGKQINSQYDEISPFIHANNKTLYFASNGLPGFGGYDLFYVERTPENSWSNPVNVGGPINNHQDQFSLFITADGNKGYYVHEERVKEGYDASKIYETNIPEKFRVKFRSNYVKGIIRAKESKAKLAADIELININTNEVVSFVRSDSVSGEYLMVLTQGAEYALYVNKKGYLFQSLNFNYSEIENFEPITLDVELEKVKEGSVSVLKNIFFDTDKYDLQEKSITELQKIIRFLNENPATRIEISGHTDNVGSVTYNRQLSENRAKSVYNYLTKNGVDPKRMMPKGYGADKPVGSNDTEEGRQLNRRIEFKVIR